MPQLFDITTSILYKQGLEQLEQGLEKKLLILITNMLTKSELPLNQIANLSEASIEKVRFVKEKLDDQEWSHPEHWTGKMWSDYFSINDK